jgi:hypothetical protein
MLEEKYEKRRDLLLKIYKASDKNMDRQMTLAEFHHLAGKDKPQKLNLWQEYEKTDNPGRVPSSCLQRINHKSQASDKNLERQICIIVCSQNT